MCRRTFGEQEMSGDTQDVTRFRSRGGITAEAPWLLVSGSSSQARNATGECSLPLSVHEGHGLLKTRCPSDPRSRSPGTRYRNQVIAGGPEQRRSAGWHRLRKPSTVATSCRSSSSEGER